jgi:hypothetical protein
MTPAHNYGSIVHEVLAREGALIAAASVLGPGCEWRR